MYLSFNKNDLESICGADYLNTEKESGGSHETEK